MLAPGILSGLLLMGGWLYWRAARRRTRQRLAARLDHLGPASPAGLRGANVTWYPHPPPAGTGEAALTRHPAGRSRTTGSQPPAGPDDDPEFLRLLAWRIRNGLVE